MVTSLSPGQTGCLRAGTFAENLNVYKPSLTLTSYPDERATLKGRLFVSDKASGMTVASLDLDGRSANPDSASPTIDGDNVIFRDNDVTTYNTAICFDLGFPGYGRAENVVIESNNIHNCGKLPAAGHDHGIYLALTDHVVVRNNWIHHNADYGIHFYPDSQNTTVTGNVIDSNGAGILFAGEGGTASSGNIVQHNAITNSLRRHNVESSWPLGGPIGTGNLVTDNCIAGAYDWFAEADGSGIAKPQVGFTASNNLVVNPQYLDPAHGDYRLQATDPCASILSGAGVDPTQVPVNSEPPPPGTDSPPPTDPPPSTEPPRKGKKKKTLTRRARAKRARRSK